MSEKKPVKKKKEEVLPIGHKYIASKGKLKPKHENVIEHWSIFKVFGGWFVRGYQQGMGRQAEPIQYHIPDPEFSLEKDLDKFYSKLFKESEKQETDIEVNRQRRQKTRFVKERSKEAWGPQG